MIFFDKFADKIELIKLLSALIYSYQKTEQENKKVEVRFCHSSNDEKQLLPC